MNFKNFMLDVLNRIVNASWYRTVGCSPEEASFLADMEANTALLGRREEGLRSSVLAERRCSLPEESRDTEHPETLESVCATSGDVEAYIAEKAKTDAKYAAVQKELQQIDASKAALEKRRRKLYEGNPELYERTEKIRQEANQRREEFKKKKD